MYGVASAMLLLVAGTSMAPKLPLPRPWPPTPSSGASSVVLWVLFATGAASVAKSLLSVVDMMAVLMLVTSCQTPGTDSSWQQRKSRKKLVELEYGYMDGALVRSQI